jgi:hypothetical protein
MPVTFPRQRRLAALALPVILVVAACTSPGGASPSPSAMMEEPSASDSMMEHPSPSDMMEEPSASDSMMEHPSPSDMMEEPSASDSMMEAPSMTTP